MASHHIRGPREMVSGGEWIYGRNPVEEVLAAGRRTCSEVILPPQDFFDDQLQRIADECHSRRIMIRRMDRKDLDKLTHFGHHQGVAIKTTGYPYAGFGEILSDVQDNGNAFVVVLDHLEDPQNVGAILRTACAAGATGVVIAEDRACGITPAAVRASAGGSEYLKIAHVVNIPRAIEDLKDAGVWFTGLDWGDDSRLYTEIDFKGPSGIVVGAEGDGIGRLVREKCDFIARLPMPGGFESLNAATAASIVMYEALRQRG